MRTALGVLLSQELHNPEVVGSSPSTASIPKTACRASSGQSSGFCFAQIYDKFREIYSNFTVYIVASEPYVRSYRTTSPINVS